jgi:hypothetical protein
MRLEDVELIPDRLLHRQGGFADVYQGIREGQLLAVKKPRSVGNAVVNQQVLHPLTGSSNMFSSYLLEIVP